jgi:hypothetical protein
MLIKRTLYPARGGAGVGGAPQAACTANSSAAANALRVVMSFTQGA